MTVNFCYNHYHFNKLYCHLYRVRLKFLERGKFMKKQKLLICMLSSTLVLPSLPVSHIHAETAKHISETPQSEETSSDESSSLDDKSKSEETPSDETASSNEETQTEKSSSSNKKEENTKSSQTKDTPRATQEEQRDEDSNRPSSYLNDHFSNDYDFINPSPFKSLSLSNMWHTWFSSDHQATESEQPSPETPSSEAPTTDNTTSTDEAQSAPTTQDEPSPEKPATESTPSRDNSYLSESDKAIADELDRISDLRYHLKRQTNRTILLKNRLLLRKRRNRPQHRTLQRKHQKHLRQMLTQMCLQTKHLQLKQRHHNPLQMKMRPPQVQTTM